MQQIRKCACLICRLEEASLYDLGLPANRSAYLQMLLLEPALSVYPTALDLVRNLHAAENTRSLPSSDGVLAELIRSPGDDSSAALRRQVLLLVFVPTMHRTASQIANTFPSLARDDIAQHVITLLLEALGAREVRLRQSHLAFTIARRVRRAAFRWAIRETRIAGAGHPDEPDTGTAGPVRLAHGSEAAVLLSEFLDACESRGWLTPVERRLLLQAKIDGVSCHELSRRNGHSSVAIQHRIHRVIERLRRLTRKPVPAPVQLELFPH